MYGMSLSHLCRAQLEATANARMEACQSAWISTALISTALLITTLGCISARFIDTGKNKKWYTYPLNPL